MLLNEWDGVVGAVLDATGLAAQPDAMALAWACGLELWPKRRSGASLQGLRVCFDRSAPLASQRVMVARCVARWALELHGLTATENAIRYVAERLTNPVCAHSSQGSRGVVVPLLPVDRQGPVRSRLRSR